MERFPGSSVALACIGILAAALSPWVSAAGVNVAAPGLPMATAYGLVLDNNELSAMCVDCHGRNPSARTYADNTGLGTHFVFDQAHPTRITGIEKLDAWASGGVSKYGNFATRKSVTGVAGELICESCHSLRYNELVPTGDNATTNFKLLLYDSEKTDPSPLCGGCHGNTGSGHHALTGDPIGTRNGLPLSTTAGSAFAVPLDGLTYPGPDKVNCRSCHRGHDGATAAGARVLKTGVGTGVMGVGTTGLERQFDIDPAVPPTNKLVTDQTPLCLSCHDN